MSNSKLGTNTIKAQLKVDDLTLTTKKNIDIYSDTKPIIYKYGYDVSKHIFEEKKVGRNDKCPCGSGKKYKHCCGSV